jgi:hypothetical protein
MDLTFDEWISYGLEKGWCGPPVCYTHDGLPMSEHEMQGFDDGEDPCMKLRLITHRHYGGIRTQTSIPYSQEYGWNKEK